ncbi:MAG: alpha/beta hydrolase [Pseudomonadota bacterium]
MLRRSEAGDALPVAMIIRSIGVMLAGAGIFLLLMSNTYTPVIKDENGRIIEMAIAEERRMNLGGEEQYVLIRGYDRSSPLLIFLHGGPGYSVMPFNRLRNADLEQDFIFVNWDQRGAGYSYRAARDPKTLTLDRIISDLDELIDALCAEFDQEKVILVGHSWGSLVGLTYIDWRPEKVAGYIGVSQFSNNPASEREGYEWALAEARARNDVKSIDTLAEVGFPPYDSVDEMWKQRRILNKMGGVWFEPKPDYYYVIEYLRAAEFAWPGLWSLRRGGQLSIEKLFSTAFTANAAVAYPELETPIFFIEGRHDHVVSTRQAELYFNTLSAPYKELIWFEHSAHAPNWEEPEKFNNEVRRIGKELGLLD